VLKPKSILWLIIFLLNAVPAFAQEIAPGQPVNFMGLLPAALLLFWPIGLILLMSSAMPQEEAPATAINLLMAWSVAALAYFTVGFAFHFGGIAQVSPNPDFSGLYWEWYPLDQSVDLEVARLWGIVALQGWALTGEAATPGALNLFLSHLSLVGTAAIIPAAIVRQRSNGLIALLVGIVTGAFIYPLAGNWMWGGGWLSHLGSSLGWGHGLVDFGGGGLIFLPAGGVTLVTLLLFRQAPGEKNKSGVTPDSEVVVVAGSSRRLTVYEESAAATEEEMALSPAPMPPAYLPILSMLGAGFMLMGWLGLATGTHLPTAINFSAAYAATNGLLAALAGALTAAAYSWFTTQQFNPLMTSRGLVAGLIVAAAGAPFVPIWLGVVAGLLMGLALPPLIYLFNQGLRLADELGTLATFGVSAIASLLLVAFFADGHAGQGWNGVGLAEYLSVSGQGVSGLLVASGFVADWPGQLQAQVLGLGIILLWTALVSLLLLQTIKAVADAWRRTGLELAGRAPRLDTDEPVDS
jgi:Amt family ammonium transporter